MKTVLSAALAVMLCTAAHAADYKPGPYAGVTIGYAAGSLTNNSGDLTTSGAPVSGIVGYTHSLGEIGGLHPVIGIEGEATWANVKGSQTDRGFELQASTDYTLALKARAGIAIGPALIYALAGPAWAHSKLEIIGLKDSHLGLGVMAGGGVDVQITHTLAIRIEGVRTFAAGSTDWRLGNAAPIRLDSGETTIRAGLVFSLN